MADDINNPETNQEQEYEFPDKHSQEFGKTPHSGGTESLTSLLKNKQVMYAVGGIVGLYVLLSAFSGDDDEVVDPAVEEARAAAVAAKLKPLQIEATHFEMALNKVQPSVNKKDRERYHKMQSQISMGRDNE